jgi:hypothetical protein
MPSSRNCAGRCMSQWRRSERGWNGWWTAITVITPCRETWLCSGVFESGSAATGGTFYVVVVSGGSRIGSNCGRSLILGFLALVLFIPIPISPSTLVSKGGAYAVIPQVRICAGGDQLKTRSLVKYAANCGTAANAGTGCGLSFRSFGVWAAVPGLTSLGFPHLRRPRHTWNILFLGRG